jgi:hypothetical protein
MNLDTRVGTSHLGISHPPTQQNELKKIMAFLKAGIFIQKLMKSFFEN